jgi:hypothetical protein
MPKLSSSTYTYATIDIVEMKSRGAEFVQL